MGVNKIAYCMKYLSSKAFRNQSLKYGLAWGARGRKFESCRPDFITVPLLWDGFIFNEVLVYILKSLKDHKYYIGSTADVTARLKFHNEGVQRSEDA
jgi:hypothetical protein